MRERLSSLMEQYTEDQNNLDVVKKIGGLYEEMGYAPDAHVFYSWAFELSDNDISLKNKATLMKKKMDDEEFRKRNVRKKLLKTLKLELMQILQTRPYALILELP